MTTLLQQICADKRLHIAASKTHISLGELEHKANAVAPPLDFVGALRAASKANGFGLIAEIKRGSPSRGIIRENFDPASHAKAYEAGGATCLSVLTDIPYFHGEDSHLLAVRGSCSLPILRKDFMLDPYQVIEARAMGADCILIVMAAVSDNEAAELETTAHALGMAVLIETHTESEVERALTHLQSPLIGINNRDLHTFETDLKTTESLAPLIPDDRIIVCESGISTHGDIQRMADVRARCFLVGESLLTQEDLTTATEKLLRG